MNSEQAQELYSDYLTGDIDPAMSVKLESFLAENETGRGEVAALRSLWADLDQMPVVEPPKLLHANIMERIDAAREEESAPKRRVVWDLRALFRPRALAVAASALIVALAGMHLVQTQSAELGPFGQIARWLNPGTTPHAQLSMAKADWAPTVGQAGSLAVHLTAGPTGSVDYIVTLKRRISSEAPAQELVIASAKGHLAADESGTLQLRLDSAPNTSTDQLTVTTTPEEGQQGQVLTVPLQ